MCAPAVVRLVLGKAARAAGRTRRSARAVLPDREPGPPRPGSGRAAGATDRIAAFGPGATGRNFPGDQVSAGSPQPGYIGGAGLGLRRAARYGHGMVSPAGRAKRVTLRVEATGMSGRMNVRW